MATETGELKSALHWWEARLTSDKWLMDITTVYFVEHTIKYLRELLVIKSKS